MIKNRCLAFVFLALFFTLPACGEIARIGLNGDINPITAEFAIQGIAKAENDREVVTNHGRS